MWYPLCAAVATAIVLLAFRAWMTKRVTGGAIVFALMITAAIMVTPRFQPYFSNQQELRARRINFHEKVEQLPIPEQIAASRRAFALRIDEKGNIVPFLEGSLIDTDVSVNGWRDLLRLLPRALEVGLLAPFPNMWFQSGALVGIGGRLLAGIETTMTYVIECLALFGLWRARWKLSAWFLTVFALLGAVALGLAVNNIGALYRLRYPFWILIVILGAGGVEQFRRTVLKAKPQVT